MYCRFSRALARTVSACLFGLIAIVCTGYGQGAEARESCTMPASLVQIIDTSQQTAIARVEGLGDVSHASAVF